MAITLTNTFVSGAARDGSQVQQNLEDVRTWLAGQIVSADIKTGAGAARHIVRPEHYGHPLEASLGTTMDIYGCSATSAKSERAMFVQDISAAEYITCPELSRTVHLERASTVMVVLRWHAMPAWVINIETTDPAWGSYRIGVVAFTRLIINGSGIAHTRRRIVVEDAGQWSSAGLNRNNKEYSIHHLVDLAAGYHDISLGVRCMPHSYTAPLDPLDDSTVLAGGFNNDGAVGNYVKRIDIQVRSFRVEINPYAL